MIGDHLCEKKSSAEPFHKKLHIIRKTSFQNRREDHVIYVLPVKTDQLDHTVDPAGDRLLPPHAQDVPGSEVGDRAVHGGRKDVQEPFPAQVAALTLSDPYGDHAGRRLLSALYARRLPGKAFRYRLHPDRDRDLWHIHDDALLAHLQLFRQRLFL